MRRPFCALVVGQDRQETPLRYLVRGMRLEGWEIDVINPDEFYIGGSGPETRVLSKLTSALSRRSVKAAIADRAKRLQPQVVLGIKSIPFSDDGSEITQMGSRMAIWYPDVSFDHAGLDGAKMLTRIDLFATTKHYHLPYMAEAYPDTATTFIAHGYCDDVHHPPQNPPAKDFDVVYVGNHSPAKQSALSALAAARPTLSIAISGHGWSDDTRWRRFEPVLGEAMGRFLARGRIALAIHYGPHGVFGWEDTTSARTFEIPACGQFMLHPDNEEVRRYFDPKLEIGLFRGPDEMVAGVDFWMANPGAREMAAARACRRARPAYSYSERGRELARWLESQVNQS